MIRIEGVPLNLDQDESGLKKIVAKIISLPEKEIVNLEVVKKAIDARNKRRVFFVYSVDLELVDESLIKEWQGRYRIRKHERFNYQINKVSKNVSDRVVVIGSGPAGLFSALLLAKAGLKPLIIERGKDVDNRIKDVEVFRSQGILNTESNIQFGEGGAGTFSDGKLYTLINDPRSSFIFKELVKAGAPREITSEAHPHIGTDILRKVVKNLRASILELGGEIRFSSCLTGLKVKSGKISGIIINNQEEIKVDKLILAIGHSARDTYQMLFDNGLKMEAKPFSMGLRIEHKAEMINRVQYGNFFNHPKLGTANYKLVEHTSELRPVYTFCMCPGGYVIPASSEIGHLVVNGMSQYFQDAENSNSALLVPVKTSDFASNSPLAGIDFQRTWEKKAFILGGGNYHAPIQLVGDFLENKKTNILGSVKPSYQPGTKFSKLDDCLPDFVAKSIRKALLNLDKKIKGFADPGAVLTGVETRSSSPLRILRGQDFQSNILNIYPCGEGAGYAGGISSSAIDGLSVAEEIIKEYI